MGAGLAGPSMETSESKLYGGFRGGPKSMAALYVSVDTRIVHAVRQSTGYDGATVDNINNRDLEMRHCKDKTREPSSLPCSLSTVHPLFTPPFPSF